MGPVTVLGANDGRFANNLVALVAAVDNEVPHGVFLFVIHVLVCGVGQDSTMVRHQRFGAVDGCNNRFGGYFWAGYLPRNKR